MAISQRISIEECQKPYPRSVGINPKYPMSGVGGWVCGCGCGWVGVWVCGCVGVGVGVGWWVGVGG